MATFNRERFKPVYADNDDKKITRTIGLELEVKFTDKKCLLYRKNLTEYIRMENGVFKTTDDALKEEKINEIFVGLGFDGTDLELVTQPESITLYRQGGSDNLKKGFEYLKKHAVGGKKAPNSGTHINVGHLSNENTTYVMDNAYWIMMNFAPQLQKIAGRISRWCYFQPYRGQRVRVISIGGDDNIGETIIRSTKPDGMDHAASNGAKGTMLVHKPSVYEFRIFKSSVDLEEVLAWSELCYNIINIASGEIPIDLVRFRNLLKGNYIENYVASLKGERALTTVETLSTIENTLSFESRTSNNTIIL